jgi:DNA-binding GntR family transcriptional regulator
MRQQVYDQLRKRIITANIPPGQVMTIQGLAREFGVSVMPVREALWQLESEKVIVIQSNKRIYVNALTRKDMEEALNLRLVLEPIAAERSCDRITDSELAQLKRIVTEMEVAFDQSDRFFSLNNEFHFCMYAASDSPMLLQILDTLWARVGPYLNINWDNKGRHSSVIKCHRLMCKALAKRDKQRLKEWLIEDLKHAAATIMPLLQDAPSGTETTVTIKGLPKR